MDRSVSVITINFNNASGLELTIQSVASQSFKKIQYIVVDGGSSDRSVNIIRKYESDIHYWVSEQDRGIYHAMNKGIKVATADYLLFLNSGDYFVSKNSLGDFVRQCDEEDILLGNIVGSDGREIKLWYTIDFYNIWRYGAHHQAMLIKRTLFDEIGLYRDSGDITADWQFLMLSLFKFQKKAKYIDVSVSVYDLAGISSLKEKQPSIKRERLKFLKEHFPNRSAYQIAAVNSSRLFFRRLKALLVKLRKLKKEEIG